MKTTNDIITTLTLAALLLGGLPSLAATSSERLQDGLYAEEVEGNIESAIRSYQAVIEDGSAPASHVAQALYRLAVCSMKIQDDAAANAALQELISNYPEQTELLEKARPLLDKLADFDPALLMPPDTLAYLELGSPGEQIETLLTMLEGTPYENPLAAIGAPSAGGPAAKSPAQLVSALLNPKMTAEFKKIRSSAVGVIGFEANHPQMIAVLYPGESDALAGIIRAGLEMAGHPAAPIEGMTRLDLPEDMAVACDDRVIIAARPASRLAWSVRQYKGLASDPSLVTGNTSFMKLNRGQRRKNALTAWVKVDEFYATLRSLFPADQIPQQVRAADVWLDFANIDQVLWMDTLEADGLRSKIDVHLNEGHNCLAYNLMRTPNLSREALAAVPQEAIAFATLSLSDMEEGRSDQVVSKVRDITGLDIGRELFDNLEQLTLFVMPGGPDAQGESFPFHLGLTLTSRNPDQTREVLATLMETMAGGQPTGEPGRLTLSLPGQPAFDCYIRQARGITTLSLNPEIVDQMVAAVDRQQSVAQTGPLHGAVASLPAIASKLTLVNIGGAVRLLHPEWMPGGLTDEEIEQVNSDFDALALATDGITLEVRTDEIDNRLTLNWGVNGLPPLRQVIDPMMRIAQISEQAGARRQPGSLSTGPSMLILPTTDAPVIDGEEDAIWSRAPRYTLDNVPETFADGTRAVPPDSPADLSAGFRALWDADALYLLIDVTDDQLVNDTSGTDPVVIPDGTSVIAWWYDDSVEVYLDADNARPSEYGEKDAHYHFDWDRDRPTMGYHNLSRDVHILNQPGPLNGVDFAMVTTDTGYRTEIRFPWTALGTRPSVGGRVGLDVHVNDDDNGLERDTKITWHDTEDSAWINPQAFGTAVLGGLVGWWPFDEKTDRTAADRSGGNHDGQLIGGATWADGKLGGAVALNGTDGFVRVEKDPAFDMANQMTVACWANLRALDHPHTALVTKGDSSWRLSMAGSGSRLHMAVAASQEAKLDGQTELPFNEWHHVAAVYDGKTLRLYVDGKLDAKRPYTGLVARNDLDVLIGENAERSQRWFNGRLDEVRVYNYALTSEEIGALALEGQTP